jgi:glycosyltransferase involved in cell wall biosynthesis
MTSGPVRPKLDLVMPVHNEGGAIERTLREWYAELSPAVDLRFVIAEDGSLDNTKEVLRKLEKELPMHLDMADYRRGYAGAVVAGMSATSSPHVSVVDSDGQCDPRDFWQFWEKREEFDVIIGWRVNRRDPLARKLMSRCFGLLHRMMFHATVRDPSCPYLLIRRSLLDKLLPVLGSLREGFWWEFVARASRANIRFGELPVTHRDRAAGKTVVYRPSEIPGIAWRNGAGLVKIWRGR